MDTSTRNKKGFRWATVPGIAAVGAVFALAGGAYADQTNVDSDTSTAAADHVYTFNVGPNDPVSGSAQIRIDHQGSKHLAGGTSVEYTNDTAAGGTDLPSPYLVGEPSIAVPSTGWGTTTTLLTGTANFSFNAPASSGTYNYKIQWTTGGYSCVSSPCLNANVQANITVNVSSANNPPNVSAGGPYSGAEGSAIDLNGSAIDPDGPTPLTTTWSIDSSSVSPGSCSIQNPSSPGDATITCTDNGTAVVKLTATDGANASSSATANVTINNANPAFDSGKPAFASASVNCANRIVSLNFAFSDPGSADTHTATINWGDDSPVENLNEAATAAGSKSHPYNSGGPYTAVVTVTDDDLGSTGATNSTNSLIVQYNLSSILQPVNDTRNGQLSSVFKYGSVVPVKVEITDCAGAHPSTLDVRVFYALFSGNPPAAGEDEAALAIQADAGNQARFSDPIYIYNWSTKKVNDPSSTVRLTVKIMSGSTVIQSTYSDIGLKK